MAVFKGGPALPKRTERADEGDDAMSGKRQRRTTELLSNPIHEGQPDDDNSTTQRNNSRKDANKMPMVIEGGDTAKPVSELRSTMDAEMDDAREGSTTPVKEEFDLPPRPPRPRSAPRSRPSATTFSRLLPRRRKPAPAPPLNVRLGSRLRLPA